MMSSTSGFSACTSALKLLCSARPGSPLSGPAAEVRRCTGTQAARALFGRPAARSMLSSSLPVSPAKGSAAALSAAVSISSSQRAEAPAAGSYTARAAPSVHTLPVAVGAPCAEPPLGVVTTDGVGAGGGAAGRTAAAGGGAAASEAAPGGCHRRMPISRSMARWRLSRSRLMRWLSAGGMLRGLSCGAQGFAHHHRIFALEGAERVVVAACANLVKAVVFVDLLCMGVADAHL